MTRFKTAAATRQDRETLSLRQLADLVRETRAPTKAELPWLKLASFGNVPTMKGSLRSDLNLREVEGVEGDYDAEKVSVGEVCAMLRAANLAALVYTTPSHTDAAPRWRVLAPASAALSPEQRDHLAERLNGALGGILAKESFTRSQAYYFGAVGTGEAHSVHLVDGRPIDAAAELPRIGRRIPDAEQPADDESDDGTWFLGSPPDWDRINEALAFIPSDDRDDWLKVGMALHADGRGSDEARAAWAVWSATSEKFDARDLERVWKSFGDGRGRAVTIASLYDLAKQRGWNAKATKTPATSGLTFLTPDDCATSPSRGYVIKGIVAPGDVGCIFGAPGAGKSMISPHLAYAVAQGRQAFGMRTKPGKVFYVAAEDAHGMRGRVTALKARHGSADEFVLVEGVSNLLDEESPDIAALAAAVEAQRPSLIFIDTMAMAFPGLEENSAEAMGKVVATARALTRWDAAVILVHHDTKAEGKTPRGHSLLNGALDMAMYVVKGEDGFIRGKLTKNRNGSCDREIAFSIGVEVLGTDEDGDPVTAGMAVEATDLPEPKDRLTPSARAALIILERLEMYNAADGAALPGVLETEWRDACVSERTVSGSEEVDSRKKAFRRAVKELAGHGRTLMRGDFVLSRKPLSAFDFHTDGDGLDE